METIMATKPIKMWVNQIEHAAMQQLRNTASLDVVAKEGIAVMPDVHWGIGATVGSVVPTIDAIIPAAVGVDIGCGMAWHGSDVPADVIAERLPEIRHALERTIPVGRGEYQGEKIPSLAKGLWVDALEGPYKDIMRRHPKISPKGKHPLKQLGTLGGGNHFIEVVVDQNEHLGVMLHSGSRGIGNLIGRYFIERAKMEMEILGVKLPDHDLAYLRAGSPGYIDYVDALTWAQSYAAYNREVMLKDVIKQVMYYIPDEYKEQWFLAPHSVSCHHNYVSWERHFGQDMIITRKGAVDASAGKMVIIPGSMGAKSFIGVGLNNADSYHSCSHGAGRRMSRGEAKRQFTVNDLAEQTQGVECRKDDGVLDEIPGAYKPIDEVMEAQRELVSPVYELKQLICVKG